jgi:hypothetical protein
MTTGAVCGHHRKINFDEFQRAFTALSKLKFPGKSDAEATAELSALVLRGGGPVATGTVRCSS